MIRSTIKQCTNNQYLLLDLTPEYEVRKSLLDSARAELESVSLVGKRLVSETEWQLLEEEVNIISCVSLMSFQINCN